jgi:hypothetical protein
MKTYIIFLWILSVIFWWNELIAYFYPELRNLIIIIAEVTSAIWKILEVSEYISKQ